MAALSLQQLSVSHEVLKANKAMYTIIFDKLCATCPILNKINKKLVLLFVVHFNMNQSVLSILSFSLLGRTQNVPQIMCKTILLPPVFWILARKWSMKTMNVFNSSKYLITAVLQIVGNFFVCSPCSDSGAAIKRSLERSGYKWCSLPTHRFSGMKILWEIQYLKLH